MRTIVNARARARGKENPKNKLLSRAVLLGTTAILIYLALVKLIIHLLTANNYGYFVDEFYWLAMAKHLDFGYVDVTPLVAYVGAGWRLLFGASLLSIRILPALAGAVMVFFAGLLAREMGGGRFAQGFTALLVLTAPIWLMFNSLFAYDPFDQLCSIILFYLIVRLIKKETPRRWIGLGIMAGLGILTKQTMVFTVGALVLSILASPGRKSFLTKWPWLAAGIAILLCTPYTIWQWVHGWPLITYSQGYTVNRFMFLVSGNSRGLLQFLWGSLLSFNPFLLPVLLLGLCYLLFYPEGKKYRPLGLSFLVLLIFYICVKLGPLAPKFLISTCFPLLAASVVWLEKIINGAAPSSRERGKGTFRLTPWLVRAYLGVILIFSLILAPLALPVLPIDALKKYEAVTPRFITETFTMGTELPLQFAFRFGWPELVQKVAEIYHRLPEAEQKKCVILTEFYGHAGAIDLLGKKYGLPNAISTHLSYYFWGTDPDRTGVDPEVAIVVSFSLYSRLPNAVFDEVTLMGFTTSNPLCSVLSKNLPIFVCRKPKRPLKEIWPRLANFY
jgi:4-amino-4-deoxy-L-arabinose transferase-like glycosyltransferase